MRSIRTQFLLFVFVLLAILIVLLNIFPLTASRDQVFEEKKASLSAQASVISSSLGGLDTLSRESVSDVLTFLDISGFARMIVTDSSGIAVYDDGGQTGVVPEIEDLFPSLGGKIIFRSVFRDSAFQSSVITPISSRQGLITGAVYLYEYDAERAGILLEIQSRIRNISLAIGLVALATVILFSELIIHRIRELVASIRIVAAGNYDHRLTTHGHDEITELGEEFNQLTERLDTTEKQRRRFVSDASHELKTPLASIRLLSDSIVQNDGMDPGTVREFASDIGNEAERLQRTTEKLLDLSRLDDDIQVAPEPVDLKQTVMDAVSSLGPVAAERKVGCLVFERKVRLGAKMLMTANGRCNFTKDISAEQMLEDIGEPVASFVAPALRRCPPSMIAAGFMQRPRTKGLPGSLAAFSLILAAMWRAAQREASAEVLRIMTFILV